MGSFDVIIIGAGPAGLKCAETFGGTKLKVLLIDKKKVIGPKICAGGLTALDSHFKIPIGKTLSFKTQHIILNGKEKEFSLKNPLLTIDRYDLGQFQLKLVKKFKNIEIKTNVLVKEINKNHILTNEGKKYNFKTLIGADGSTSLVRKYLGLESKIFLGIQYIIPIKHNKLVWFLNPKLLTSGYGWIFPHKNFTSAGVFFNPKHIDSKKAKEVLNKLLDDYGLDYSNATFEGSPTNCLFKGFQFNNIFLAGDAAGLVSACTGEGISYALASGFDVAKHIIDNNYQFDNVKNILKYKRRQEFLLWIFDRIPISYIQTLMFKLFVKSMRHPKFQHYFGD